MTDRTLFLTEREVANLLKISTKKLQADRFYGRGLPYIKLGGAVRYKLDHIMEAVEKSVVKPRQ